MKRLLLLLPVVVLLVFAACTADTEPATDVTATSAKLHGNIKCDQGDGSGEWWWELGPSGSFNRVGNRNPFNCQGNATQSVPIEFAATGLTPSTHYQFRLCQWSSAQQANTVCADANGRVFGPGSPPSSVVYDTFQTADPPAGCDRNATTATFQAELNAATNGQRICLATGNYGEWTGTNKAVTITEQPGASAAMSVYLENGTGDANFTLDGLTVRGLEAYNPQTAKNVKFDNVEFTSHTRIDGPCNTGMVIEDSTFNGINSPLANGFDTARINLPYSECNSGIIFRRNVLEGGNSDGMQTGSGMVVEDNVFRNICPNDAVSENHTDMLQMNGATGLQVRRNLFIITNSCASAQMLSGYDGIDHVLIEDNVIAGSGSQMRPWYLELYSDDGSIVRHNTLLTRPGGERCEYTQVCGQIYLSHKPGTSPWAEGNDPGRDTQIYDNIAYLIDTSGEGTARNDHNLLVQGTSPNIIDGHAQYVGGTFPTTYQGYKLAPGSPGIGAASDGLNVGARIP